MENFELFYHEDTIEVRYKDQVENMISFVFHDIHWWHLMNNDNAVFVLDKYCYNYGIDAL